MLRDLTFPKYDPAAKDEFGFPPVQSRGWTLFWQAIAGAPAGNVELTARGVAVFGKLKASSEPGQGEGNRRLKQAGVTIRLTNEELDYCKRMVERLREQVPVAQGDALMYLDDLFASAPTLNEEDLVPKESLGA